VATHFDSVTPIYIQIADDLRHQILIGTLKEGDQVMSTTAYATTMRINPATAAKAFSLLIDEDLLEKRRGIGMFVHAGARERLRERGRAAYFTDVLDPALAQGLDLGLDTEALIAHVRALAASRPAEAEDLQ
jgi:DNA-binding transcriptional regulator YhcF (GntR family)